MTIRQRHALRRRAAIVAIELCWAFAAVLILTGLGFAFFAGILEAPL